jgi:hypothetical protein
MNPIPILDRVLRHMIVKGTRGSAPFRRILGALRTSDEIATERKEALSFCFGPQTTSIGPYCDLVTMSRRCWTRCLRPFLIAERCGTWGKLWAARNNDQGSTFAG